MEWFIIVFFKSFNREFRDEPSTVIDVVDQLFEKYKHNYKLFLHNYFIKFNINDETIMQNFYKSETFCINCNTNYPIVLDPFVVLYDNNKKDITFDLCIECITYFCKKCGKGKEPWFKLFKQKDFYVCGDCHKT
jgi:hypothetical protein